MNADLVLQLGCAAVLTYLVHSTLLLGGVWLMERLQVLRSFSLRERVWRFATIGAVLTAAAQLFAVQLRPVYSLSLADVFAIESAKESAQADHASREAAGRRRIAGAMAAEAVRTESTWPDPSSQRELNVVQSPADASASPANLGVPGPVGAAADVESGASAAPVLTPADWPTPRTLALRERHQSTPTSRKVDAVSIRNAADSSAESATVEFSRLGISGIDTDWRDNLGRSAGKLLPLFRPGAVILASIVLLIGAARCLSARRLLTRTLRQAETITDGVAFRVLYAMMQKRSVTRQVRLLRSSQLTEPSAFGVRHWTILLPAGIETRLSRSELDALLAHELAHLVRRDPFWQILSRIVTLCLPWQPLNFVAARRLRICAECLCDRWAVVGGVKPVTLAACLTRVAEWKLTGETIPGLTATGTSLSDRVEMLISGDMDVDRWTRSGRRRTLEASLVMGVFMVTCFGPRVVWNSAAGVSVSAGHVQVAGRGLLTRVAAGPANPVVPTHSGALSDRNDILRELDAVRQELDDALRMLAAEERDPVIDELVARLRSRLEGLSSRVASGRVTASTIIHQDKRREIAED